MERIDNTKSSFTEEHKYLLAKKRVEKIKGFYIHLAVYIGVNIFISAIIIGWAFLEPTYFSEKIGRKGKLKNRWTIINFNFENQTIT